MTPPRNAWSTLIAYAFAASAAMGLQLVFAPVTTVAAEHYGISVAAIGWLSEVFPLMYVLVSIPAGLLLDRWFRGGLFLGAMMIAIGASLRLVGDSFGWALAGQCVAAVGQPLILNGITKLAGDYLHEKYRSIGIAAAMASIYIGELLAIGLGSVLSEASQLPLLNLISVVYTVASAAALIICLRKPGAFVSPVEAPPGLRSLTSLWADPFMRNITVIAFIGIGIFTSLLTWLQALLEPSGVPATATGTMLLGMIVAGIIGASVLPVRAARKQREFELILLAGGVGVMALLLLALWPRAGVGMVVMPIDGLFLLAVMPVILELTERRAGPKAGTATALIWLAGNLGSLLIAMSVQALINRPLAAFALMTVISTLVVPLVLLLRRQARVAPPALG